MQVKRFFAADMRQAMKLIKEELGNDAAIIGNRKVAGGIELVAAVNYPAHVTHSVRPNPALEAELRKTRSSLVSARKRLSMAADVSDRMERDRPVKQPTPPTVTPELAVASAAPRPALKPVAPVAAVEPVPAVPASPSLDPKAFDAMRSELHGLRELMEIQMGTMAWGRLQRRQPNQAILWRRLQRMGIPAALSEELLKKVANIQDSQQAWRIVLAHLAQGIKTTKQEPLADGGVIALVGPAGAGKTTTLSKLAARYVMKHGAQHIALVSMDNFRIGAQEQLRTLGRILNIPVVPVGNSQSLAKAVASLADKKVILVDTAGLPASDPAFKAQMAALADKRVRAKNYLVMAATSQPQALKAAVNNHKACGLTGCILTKLDEAGSLGDTLGLVIGHSLPVAYLTDGPRIPDDLHLPRAHRLVSRAVMLQTGEDEPTEEKMADVFANLYREREPVRRIG